MPLVCRWGDYRASGSRPNLCVLCVGLTGHHTSATLLLAWKFGRASILPPSPFQFIHPLPLPCPFFVLVSLCLPHTLPCGAIPATQSLLEKLLTHWSTCHFHLLWTQRESQFPVVPGVVCREWVAGGPLWVRSITNWQALPLTCPLVMAYVM